MHTTKYIINDVFRTLLIKTNLFAVQINSFCHEVMFLFLFYLITYVYN